jgi:hypothetical protein
MERQQRKTAARRAQVRTFHGPVPGDKLRKQSRVQKAVAEAQKFFKNVQVSARRHAEEEVQ